MTVQHIRRHRSDDQHTLSTLMFDPLTITLPFCRGSQSQNKHPLDSIERPKSGVGDLDRLQRSSLYQATTVVQWRPLMQIKETLEEPLNQTLGQNRRHRLVHCDRSTSEWSIRPFLVVCVKMQLKQMSEVAGQVPQSDPPSLTELAWKSLRYPLSFSPFRLQRRM